jgi:hypothetical protein
MRSDTSVQQILIRPCRELATLIDFTMTHAIIDWPMKNPASLAEKERKFF